MDPSTQLYCSLSYCALLLALALIFRMFPPKKVNMIYGYRTALSMINQDTWKTANTYWLSIFVKICALNFMFPLVGYFAFPGESILITVIGTSITLLVTILLTEIFLKKNFDNNGNRI